MKALGAYLEKNGITQAAFAEDIGVSQPTIANLVNGVHGASNVLLKRISRKTGLSFDELLAEESSGAVRDSLMSHLASSSNPSNPPRRQTVTKRNTSAPLQSDISAAKSRARRSGVVG